MKLDFLRRDIEFRRKQILRQRREIRELQRLGIPSKSAEELLDRMLARVNKLCGTGQTVGGRKRKLIRAPTRSSVARSAGACGTLERFPKALEQQGLTQRSCRA